MLALVLYSLLTVKLNYINPPQQNQSYILIGGGNDSKILPIFVEMAGGTRANIVVMAPGSDIQDEALEYYTKEILRLGAQQCHAIKINTKSDCTEATARIISEATAVFICGGKQALLIERIFDTAVSREIHGVKLIAATSAGTAVMTQHSIFGETLDKKIIMGEGLGFLSNVIVDQHYSARQREWRLEQALQTYPELLGIGIDEDTAVIINKNKVRVIGDNKVILISKEGSSEFLEGREFSLQIGN
jgi:cyanophycinase